MQSLYRLWKLLFDISYPSILSNLPSGICGPWTSFDFVAGTIFSLTNLEDERNRVKIVRDVPELKVPVYFCCGRRGSISRWSDVRGAHIRAARNSANHQFRQLVTLSIELRGHSPIIANRSTKERPGFRKPAFSPISSQFKIPGFEAYLLLIDTKKRLSYNRPYVKEIHCEPA